MVTGSQGKDRFYRHGSPSHVEGFRDAGIEILEGRARFLEGGTLEVGDRRVEAQFFIVAAGARPMTLPFAGAEHLLTSDAWLELEALPERIIYVGGGFIAFEFAHFGVRLGSESAGAVILEVGDRPLGPFDAEMVDLLVEASREAGIEVHSRVQITSVEKVEDGFRVHTQEGEVFAADLVVHGAGRIPDLEDLDLAGCGRSSERGEELLSMPTCAPPTRGCSPSVIVRPRSNWPA